MPGVDPHPVTQTPDQWLNIAAFAVPAPGTWGNVARNTLRGPGLFQIDLALQKRFAISGRRNFEFRWEAFNAFNRMNLGNPYHEHQQSSAIRANHGPAEQRLRNRDGASDANDVEDELLKDR